MTFLSYGISLPCCTSSSPLALVVCGICLVACDTLLCAAQRGNVFPSCFCFFAIITANLSRFCDKSNHPAHFFLPKNRFLRYFSIRLLEILYPVPCPTEVWCPNHRCAYPGVMTQPRDRDGMRSPIPPSHGEKKNAAHCDGECSALRWRMQCTAWAHAPHCVFGSRTAGL